MQDEQKEATAHVDLHDEPGGLHPPLKRQTEIDIKHQTQQTTGWHSTIKHQTSPNIKHQPSNIRRQTSNIKHQNIRHKHGTFSVSHQT
jgi:hypothetical protein